MISSIKCHKLQSEEKARKVDPIHFMFHFLYCVPKFLLPFLLLLFIIEVEQWLTAIYSIIMWNKRGKKTHFAEVQNKCEIWHTEAMARCIVRKEIISIYIYMSFFIVGGNNTLEVLRKSWS